MKSIILVGGGGHCHSCIEVIEKNKEFTIAGIIDNDKAVGTKILGYEVIGTDSDLVQLREKFDHAIVTIGQIKTSSPRKKVYHLLEKLKFEQPSIISPFAVIAKNVTIGKGTMVFHGAIINTNAVIGDNSIINSRALIEHDVHIGNHVHISTAAVVNGGTIVKNDSFIGSGTILRESITIAENSIISFGTKV